MNKPERDSIQTIGYDAPCFIAVSPLPTELAGFLSTRKFACVIHPTNNGIAFVAKTSIDNIRSVRGEVPVTFSQELHDHPAAPVIRLALLINDQPDKPLALATFINVADARQASDLADLAEQRETYLLFYDETLKHRLTKGVGLKGNTMGAQLDKARTLLALIPQNRFNFEEAKASVIDQKGTPYEPRFSISFQES